ncbi:MAG: hypothetical protein GTN76_15805 [Candidatus Aenigmarchaeota archaeon]|nr:hypothetical protein [Candidatus Aenigmarchaeota archaeon]
MKIQVGEILKIEEMIAWQSRLPKKSRYSPAEILDIYYSLIDGRNNEKIYLEILPKK